MLLGLPWSVSSLFPLVFVAFVPLLMLEVETRDHPHSFMLFRYAFIAFFLWNILGTWWIVQAQWLGAVLIMVANALLQAFVFWCIARVRSCLRIPLLLPFLTLWMGYEHVHESWDLAWPWLALGNALATVPAYLQWIAYTGIRGATLWVLLVNFALFRLMSTFPKKGLWDMVPLGVATLLLISLPVLLSCRILARFEQEGKTITVALVQPNLDPYTEKFVPERQADHLEAFYRTAETLCDADTDYLLGPETLVVEQMDEGNPMGSPQYRQLLDFQRNHPGLTCILGVHSYQRVEAPLPGGRSNQEEGFFYEAFNSALFLSPRASPQFYHKTRLVPLFERMPFVEYMSFLGEFSLELGGYHGTYSPRGATEVFTASDPLVAILPILCFESAFGSYTVRNLPEEEGFLCLLSNDGWWKNTPGYRHHFHFSPLRAIECRRDLVRVANTGISALIDARGMVIAQTPWWEKATLKGRIHLRKGRTFFARHGDYLGRISLPLGVCFLLWGEAANFSGKRRKNG